MPACDKLASDRLAVWNAVKRRALVSLTGPQRQRVLWAWRNRYSEDEPRDEHGRWTDGGGDGGDGGSKPVEGYSPGIKTPSKPTQEAAKAVKEDWVAKSPVKTIEDVKKGAEEGQKSFGDVGRQIGAKLGITFTDPGPKTKTEKGVARTIEKAKQRGGNLARVSDTVRGGFVVNHPEQADKIIEELGKHFEVAAEPWKVTDMGYADRAANIRLPNGLIGEVQMLHPDMEKAKSGAGHGYYETARETAPNGIRPNPVQYAEAMAKGQELYNRVQGGMSPAWQMALKPPG